MKSGEKWRKFLQLSSLWFFTVTVVVGWIFYSCRQISFFTVVVDFFTVVKIIIIFLQLSFLQLSFLQLSSQQTIKILIVLHVFPDNSSLMKDVTHHPHTRSMSNIWGDLN